MRFMRFTLALLTALLVGGIFATTLQAQTSSYGRGVQDPKLSGRLPKSLNGALPVAANYQVTQTTGAITPGTSQVTGFNCGSTPPGDDCMAPVALPFDLTFYDQTFLVSSGASVNVSSNGNLQFLSNNPDYGQLDVCPPLAQFNYAIFAHWGDLTIGGVNEGVFTSITGSAPN